MPVAEQPVEVNSAEKFDTCISGPLRKIAARFARSIDRADSPPPLSREKEANK
jgi:hypothetical protein